MRRERSVPNALDWAKDVGKRAVWVGHLDSRTIRRVSPPAPGWTLAGLLGLGRDLSAQSNGPILIGIDAVLGMPRKFFDEARQAGTDTPHSFAELLPFLAREPTFFETVFTPATWNVTRPFFHVPAGSGTLRAFLERAGGRDVLLRRIDIQTGAKPPFLVSGISGTVGSGTRALWQELAPLLEARPHDLKLWPFDGALGALLTGPSVVLAETYPRICYSLALADQLPIRSRPLAKTQLEVRRAYLDTLIGASWTQGRVAIHAMEEARQNEDDFDAMIAATALLRLCIEGVPLDGSPTDAQAEGGILATSAVLFSPDQR